MINSIIRLLTVLTLIASVPETIFAAESAEELSNASVVELKQLGLGDNLIIEKINASKCNFDLTINGLKDLKTRNVPDSVISAMLAASKSAPTSLKDPENSTVKTPISENRLIPRVLWTICNHRQQVGRNETRRCYPSGAANS